MSNNFLLNITPREYQNEILKKCIEKNCLVVLPTGIGKTAAVKWVMREMEEKGLDDKFIALFSRKNTGRKTK